MDNELLLSMKNNENEDSIKEVVEARKQFDEYLKEIAYYYGGGRHNAGAFMILSKYVTEWTSLEIRIGKLLNNAYLYELIENEDYNIIFNAIDWLVKEKEILKKAYPHQVDEFNNYLNCLNEYKKIIDDTVENGFSYYDNLVISIGEPVEVES